MKVKILAYFLLAGLQFPVLFGQINNLKNTHPLDNTLVLSIDGGVTLGQTDYRSVKAGVIAKGTAEYFWAVDNYHILAAKLIATGLTINGEDARKQITEFSTDIIGIGGGISYSYYVYDKFHPYISLMYQYLWFSPKDNNGKRAPNNAKNVYERNTGNVILELGCRYQLNDYILLMVNGTANFMGSDYIDDEKIGASKDVFVSFSAGGSIALFGQRDFDGDGIYDGIDKCIDEPEDFDDFADGDGCPDFDNDNDGINDDVDKCPNDAEDLDGFEDTDGCPDEDNDGDGIIDYLDKCADTPEDIDGVEDSDGCPDIDNDGDGIDDSVDKCPNEREIFNGFEDEDGCPDEKPVPDVVNPDTLSTVEETVKETIEQQIQEVELPSRPVAPEQILIHSATTFLGEGSELNPEAFPFLDDVVDTLKKYPLEKWRIEGHIDSRTASNGDADLSYKMAKVIKEYFISKGLPSTRFTIVDMTDRFPVASNTTTFGRMQNRRVLIVRIK